VSLGNGSLPIATLPPNSGIDTVDMGLENAEIRILSFGICGGVHPRPLTTPGYARSGQASEFSMLSFVVPYVLPSSLSFIGKSHALEEEPESKHENQMYTMAWQCARWCSRLKMEKVGLWR
jgi:hypothetical protein